MKVRTYQQKARSQAAQATGQRVIDAFLSRLMHQWYDEITLQALAEDAEVTVQTIVRKFGGKDGLLQAAVEALAVRIESNREAPKGNLDALLQKLFEDYAETGDAIIRLLALEARYPALKTFLDYGRNQHRLWVAQAFKVGNNEQLLDSLVLLTDVYSWKLLHRDLGRSRSTTIAVLKKLIQQAQSGGTEE